MFNKIADMHCFYMSQGVRVKTLKLTREQMNQLIDDISFVPWYNGMYRICGIQIKIKD